MKKLLVLLSFVPIVAISQLQDSICVYARWYQLSPTIENFDVFGLDSTLPRTDDFIHVLKKMVEEDNLFLYSEKQTDNGGTEWIYIDYEEEVSIAKNDPNNKVNWQPFFTRLVPEHDIPLTDEFGEPLIKLNDKGFETYVYPDREVTELSTSDINQIIIKETLLFNSITGESDFVATDIGFYLTIDRQTRPNELFWIDFEQLTKNIDTSKTYPWLKSIVNKSYRGFLSKQVSCENLEVNRVESLHPWVLNISDSCSCSVTAGMTRRRKNFVVKIPNGCANGVNVYFGAGGTQTDVYSYKTDGDSVKKIDHIMIANEGAREYMNFQIQDSYLIKYKACYYSTNFKIIIE
jgi:hypothetical protein